MSLTGLVGSSGRARHRIPAAQSGRCVLQQAAPLFSPPVIRVRLERPPFRRSTRFRRARCVPGAVPLPLRLHRLAERRPHPIQKPTGHSMASTRPGMRPAPTDALAQHEALVHHELQGFGGWAEGMAMQLGKTAGASLFAHESAPKNFTAIDVTNPASRSWSCKTTCAPRSALQLARRRRRRHGGRVSDEPVGLKPGLRPVRHQVPGNRS